MSELADADTRLVPTPPRAGRWLAIETSGLYGSIAGGEVTHDACRVTASEPLSRESRSAATLAPAIDAMLKRLGWAPQDLATVAVASGPGSFTGLRVGVVTAKTLAYATEATLLGVDPLDVLAEGSPPSAEDRRLWTVLDAQRSELFIAHFANRDGQWIRDEATRRVSRQALLDYLQAGDRVLGPLAESLAELSERDCRFETTEPQAEALLQVAWKRWNEGAADSVFGMTPQYLRMSAAEEKLE